MSVICDLLLKDMSVFWGIPPSVLFLNTIIGDLQYNYQNKFTLRRGTFSNKGAGSLALLQIFKNTPKFLCKVYKEGKKRTFFGTEITILISYLLYQFSSTALFIVTTLSEASDFLPIFRQSDYIKIRT